MGGRYITVLVHVYSQYIHTQYVTLGKEHRDAY